MLHCWGYSAQFNSFILCSEGKWWYYTCVWSNGLGTEQCVLGPYILDAVGIQRPWRYHPFVLVQRYICGGDVSQLQDVRKSATIRSCHQVLVREGECASLVNMDQDGNGLSILAFIDHNNLFLGYGGDNWEQEEFIKPLLLRRLHSELPWYHLLW